MLRIECPHDRHSFQEGVDTRTQCGKRGNTFIFRVNMIVPVLCAFGDHFQRKLDQKAQRKPHVPWLVRKKLQIGNRYLSGMRRWRLIAASAPCVIGFHHKHQ